MIEVGQKWSSGTRSVLVVATEGGRVVVRDAYGWRRRLTERELVGGFAPTGAGRPPTQVMARRALADVDPA